MTRRVAALPCGRRTKWAVLVLWLALIGFGGPFAGKLGEVQRNDAASFLPERAESTQVIEAQKQFTGGDVALAVVVYERLSGITKADRDKAAADARKFAKIAPIKGMDPTPTTAKDGKAIQVVVPLKVGADGWQGISGPVNYMRGIAMTGAAGLNVHVTGPAGAAADTLEIFKGIDGPLLYVTFLVVIVILLVVYRSPLLWLLPFMSAGAALFISEAATYFLAKYAGLTVTGQSASILLVLVLGISTDYALLLVARYREELRRHEDRHTAMAVALHRAGPAIIASAATVTLGMLCLLSAELNSTKGLGPVAAIGVLWSLFAMVTLLPALLVAFPRWVFWPAKPDYGSTDPAHAGGWARVGRMVAARPRLTWIVSAAALAAMTFGLFVLNQAPLSTADSYRTKTDSIMGTQSLARHFPAGAGSPVLIISDKGAALQLYPVLKKTRGITQVTPVGLSGWRVAFQATLVDPPDSPAAYATIDRIRAAVRDVTGAVAEVGGMTALNSDVVRAAHRDQNVIIPLVLIVIFLILALLLRALVAPLLLIATVVLSFGAALGVSALVFKYVFGFAGTDTSVPLYAFVFLVAVGVDYNIFLVTRIREEAQRVGTRRGALTALVATGGVITSAGLVLAATFSVLAVLPLVALTEIGFVVAFGVLLDTFIVRSVLVTALVFDIGPRTWWPDALARKKDPKAADQAAERERVLLS